MAQTVTNRGKYLLSTGGVVPGTTDLRMGLLGTLSSHATAPEVNFVSDMESDAAFAELTGASGYARVALTSEASTETDGASDWALIDSDDVSFGALAAGGTIVGAFIYIHTGSDATGAVMAIYDLTSTPTNGGTVTVTTPSGILKLT